MPKISPKLIRSKRNYGYAIIPRLVINFRDQFSKPRNKVVRDFGTIRNYQRTNEDTRRRFWLELSMELIRLKTTNRISASDVDRICAVFDAEIPKIGLASKPVERTSNKAELAKRYPILAAK